MPDGLSSSTRVTLVQAVLVVAVFAVVGALLGLLWYELWTSPSGVASGGEWFTDEHGLRDDFQGTGLYVALAAPAGLVLGLLLGWRLDRSELVTLAAVLVGSLLAAWLMYLVGTQLSPADPHELAKTAADGTKLSGQLTVSSWPPRAAFPFGAMFGVAFVWFMTTRRTPQEPRTDPEPAASHGFAVGTDG